MLQIKLQTLNNKSERDSFETKISSILNSQSLISEDNFILFENNQYDVSFSKLYRYAVVRAKAEKDGYYFTTEKDLTLEEMNEKIHRVAKAKKLEVSYANWLNLLDAYYMMSIGNAKGTVQALKSFENNTIESKDSIVYVQFYIGNSGKNDIEYFRKFYPDFLK